MTSGQVSRHLLGPGHLTNGQLHNVSSTTVDDSLQSLANKLQSLTPEASELTQKALQIGNKHKVCFCIAMSPASGLILWSGCPSALCACLQLALHTGLDLTCTRCCITATCLIKSHYAQSHSTTSLLLRAQTGLPGDSDLNSGRWNLCWT